MDPRIGTVIDEWRFRACDPGYAGLHQLADDGFSGAVTVDEARGFMVNGRLIAIHGGTIESFWGSEFSAAEADDPAVPLLFTMWLGKQEFEAEYYTGETSIAEVDTTLSHGNFTGFIELSDNVFSGDYFIVYYGGTSFSVAFIGTDERLVTGEEAFQRADEEVGIFEVNSVEIEVIDIPDPEVDDSLQPESTPEPEPESEPEPEPTPDPSTDIGDADGSDADQDRNPAADSASPPEPPTNAPRDNGGPTNETEEPVEPAARKGTDAEANASQEATPDRRGGAAGQTERRGGESNLASLAAAAEGTSEDGASPLSIDEANAIDGELFVLPALDPQRTTFPPGHDGSEGTERRDTPSTPPAQSPAQPKSMPATGSTSTDRETAAATSERVSELEAELAEAEDARDELTAENERLTERIAELEDEIEELETQLADATPGQGGTGPTPAEAIAGTNVFVRYRSKADFTLDDAIEGGGDGDEVGRNLQLEWHTEFEATDVTVGEQPFEVFLEGSAHYRFASWLVSELLFELRDTGADKGLVDLYEAIPEIDRIEFDGEVPIQTSHGGERGSSVYAFDVVCRNSMGDPLLLVDLNTSREPVDGDAVSELVTKAHEVANARSSVVCAGYVTNSFYEPEALEAVTTATESGFLRGGSKDSFVRVTRKRGFHLCLIESRDDSFHVTVPEL